MDAARDCHTKWSQSERERQAPYEVTYRLNLKSIWHEQTYLWVGNRIRDGEYTAGCQRESTVIQLYLNERTYFKT